MAPRRVLHSMAYVTTPDRETARSIARTAVKRRLAACANIWPAEAMYWWKGTLEEAGEFVIVFKTRRSLIRKLIPAIPAVHPDEGPSIVSYPMGAAFPAVVDWIDAETAQR